MFQTAWNFFARNYSQARERAIDGHCSRNEGVGVLALSRDRALRRLRAAEPLRASAHSELRCHVQ